MCVGALVSIEIGGESATKPHHPISVDDESNQHLVSENRSSADIASDVNCPNNGDNVVMQEVVGAVG